MPEDGDGDVELTSLLRASLDLDASEQASSHAAARELGTVLSARLTVCCSVCCLCVCEGGPFLPVWRVWTITLASSIRPSRIQQQERSLVLPTVRTVVAALRAAEDADRAVSFLCHRVVCSGLG